MYTDTKYQYEISEEDKQLLLDSLKDEFDIDYYPEFGFKRIYHTEYMEFPTRPNSLWNGIPQLSNIKFVVENMLCRFEGSDTDKLCEEIHQKYKPKTKWFFM